MHLNQVHGMRDGGAKGSYTLLFKNGLDDDQYIPYHISSSYYNSEKGGQP